MKNVELETDNEKLKHKTEHLSLELIEKISIINNLKIDNNKLNESNSQQSETIELLKKDLELQEEKLSS